MKYVTKIILIMTCLIIMLPFSGCGRKKQVTAQKAGVLKPEAPGKEVLDHGEAVVDISNVAQGYVALRYKGSAKKISVEVIGKNNKVYKYFIERTKEPTYFPLTSGNGTYQISVYENVQDDEYSVLMMDSFEVKLKNKFQNTTESLIFKNLLTIPDLNSNLIGRTCKQYFILLKFHV